MRRRLASRSTTWRSSTSEPRKTFAHRQSRLFYGPPTASGAARPRTSRTSPARGRRPSCRRITKWSPSRRRSLKQTAEKFRKDLGLAPDQPLDSLQLDVEDVRVFRLTQTDCLQASVVNRLRNEACEEWSAMSVPLDNTEDSWAVLLNDCHIRERQRVTVLEEFGTSSWGTSSPKLPAWRRHTAAPMTR